MLSRWSQWRRAHRHLVWALSVSLVALTAVFVLFARLSQPRTTTVDTSLANAAPGPSLGDGVCADNLATSSTKVYLPTIPATRTATWAISAAQKALVNIPATATWGAYFALVNDPYPDNSTGLPLVSRAVWVVEINGVNRPDPGGVIYLHGQTSPPPVFLHHVLDVWDDVTGKELFDLSCP